MTPSVPYDDEMAQRLRSLYAERLRPVPRAPVQQEGLTWAGVLRQRALEAALADDDDDEPVAE